MNLAAADFCRQELVLLELAPHGGRTLVTAAPGLDLGSFLLLLASLERNGLFTDDENLLVLHQIFMAAHDLRFHEILDLSLRLLSRVLVLESKRRGETVGKSDVEIDLVDAGVDNTTWEVIDSSARVEEGLGVLQLLLFVDDTRLITVMLGLGVVAGEAALLASLEVELDMAGMNLMVDLHVDLTSDGVAGLIEGELSLELDFAVLEVAPLVGEEKHLKKTRLNIIIITLLSNIF